MELRWCNLYVPIGHLQISFTPIEHKISFKPPPYGMPFYNIEFTFSPTNNWDLLYEKEQTIKNVNKT